MQVGEKLKIARRYATPAMTQADLAQLLDKDRSAIGHWERGHVVPRLNDLKPFAHLLGINVGWFFDGNDGPPPINKALTPDPPAPRTTQQYTKNLKPMPSRRVKIYGTVSAGDGNANQTFDADELQIPMDMQAPDLGALIVEGSSMEPFLEPKDIAIFSDTSEPRSGYIVAAAVREVEYVVKLCAHRDGKWVLRSLNADYDDIETDYRICGYLVGFVRDRGPERLIRLNAHGLIPPDDLTRNLKS